MDAPKAISDS
jgi:DNA repair exonuclease SbcCD ATPase subunit